MSIRRLVKPNIRSLKAYRAEDIPCRVKLDANESPYPGFRIQGSGVSSKEILNNLNRYPDPEAKALRSLFARQIKIKSENILHGNGSDELIYYLITAFGGPVLYPVPTFSMYGIISQALGEENVEIPLDKKFDLDTDKTLKVIKKVKPKLIFLSSPNNPTGNSFSSDRILKIIKAASGQSLVIIDEAYQPFSGNRSFLSLLEKYENMAILRTLSKIGLAGLRVGFMVADKGIVNEVNKVRLPFNLNALSQVMAVRSLKKKDLMRSQIKSVITERKRLFREMEKLKGIEPYPSDANFILFKVQNSNKIYSGLLKRGVLVRNMNGIVNECLRVTVGTPKENSKFLKAVNSLT